MRALLLIRHAAAAAAGPGQDLERPLTPRGVAQAREQGAWLAEHGVAPDRVLCSPARRTRATAEAMGIEVTHVVKAIYEATPGELAALLESHADAEVLALFGHNPGISGLAGFLTGQRLDLRPGTVAGIRFERPLQGPPEPGTGRMRLFRHAGHVDGPELPE